MEVIRRHCCIPYQPKETVLARQGLGTIASYRPKRVKSAPDGRRSSTCTERIHSHKDTSKATTQEFNQADYVRWDTTEQRSEGKLARRMHLEQYDRPPYRSPGAEMQPDKGTSSEPALRGG